jgi:nucleotidyltransferase/DNA polymerase involved in DNA repair
MITNDARCTCGIKSNIALPKAASNKKKPFSPTNWNYCIQSFGLFLGL